MSKKHLFYAALITGATAALTVALTLALSPSTSHQSPSATAGVPPLAKATAPTSDGGQKEAIKVHGYWTIEVRNPDGTLATRREFENALGTHASLVLAQFLGRQATPGLWYIQLNACPSPCVSAWNGAGRIAEQNLPLTVAPNVSKTLEVSVPMAGANARRLVLSGRITAETNGAIGNVETRMRFCQPSASPGICGDGNTEASEVIMTGTNLSTPQELVTGQIVQVTVVISFS
jgi:hypothetical protein